MRKVLYLASILLIFVVLGELVFYMQLRGNYLKDNTSGKDNSKSITSKEGELNNSISCIDFCSKLYPSPYPEQALPESSLENLRVLKKGILKNFNIEYELDGIIESVEYSNNNPDRFFEIILSKNKNKNTFRFFRKGVENMAVKKLIEGGKTVEASISDIKKGDKVSIYFTAQIYPEFILRKVIIYLLE